MKNKKGFTLIELLAIIVILAIIAVITVPIILNIIDDAQSGAAKDSAYGFKDGINKYYVSELVKNPQFRLEDGTYTVSEVNGSAVLTGEETYTINLSGTIPTGGSIIIENNDVVGGNIQIGDYCIDLTNMTVTKGQCGVIVQATPIECFEYDVSDYTAMITGYKCGQESANPSLDLLIPEMIGNLDIVGIDSDAFNGEGLKSIKILANISFIGERAFANNDIEVAKVNFDPSWAASSEDIVTIGKNAFFGNPNLTAIHINPEIDDTPSEHKYKSTCKLYEDCQKKEVTIYGEQGFDWFTVLGNIRRGSKIAIGDQKFFALSLDDDTATIISSNCLAESGIQSDNDWECLDVPFSSTEYWLDNWTMDIIKNADSSYKYGPKKSLYGINYVDSVYDSNSNLYNYVENYKTYLINNNPQIRIDEARLVTYSEIQDAESFLMEFSLPDNVANQFKSSIEDYYWYSSVREYENVSTHTYLGWTIIMDGSPLGKSYTSSNSIKPVFVVNLNDLMFDE